MAFLNILHIIFLILTLFFVGRGIFLSWFKFRPYFRKKYPQAIDYKLFPFHIFTLYKNAIYYTFIHKDLFLSQYRKKWFLNLIYFIICAIITGILNDMLY